MLCIESHSGGRMENICVIPVSACGGLGLRRDKRKEIIQCVTWHLDITHYHVMMY